MDFEDIVNDIFLQLKEEKGTDEFWTEPEVKSAANDAYYEIADLLMCFRVSNIVKVVAGTRDYVISSSDDYILGSLTRVEFDGRRIWPITIAELDIFNESWRLVASSIPTHYIVDLESSIKIDLYPLPDTDGEDTTTATSVSADVDIGDGIDATAIVGSSIFTKIVAGTSTDDPPTDPTNNLETFFAKYPTRLSADSDQFLHPVTNNPQKILTKGAMSILLMKEGEGKDIIKASAWRKYFAEAMKKIDRLRSKGRIHTMKSISQGLGRGQVNLGSTYPPYYFR
jgi:hypothetical protein